MRRSRYHVSAYILIPLIFAGIALFSAIMGLQLPQWYPAEQAASGWVVALWTAVLVLAAFGCGVLVVRFVLEPVDRFVRLAEQHPALAASEPGPDPAERGDEVAHYTAVFDRVADVLSRVEARELFPRIIGHSTAIRGVLRQIMKVAPTDSTVLLTGESGTGKELVASSIYEHSRRRGQPFVKLNCVAIPEGLLESELFGHEKGAFTGAVSRKPGKFELADGGTILLDEIGDMPLSTQAKILRVLQEKEFERVGGTRPLKVDVRIIASTNKDLAALIDSGRFRKDLFFRLNVFSLQLPPLRQRKEDIPLLVEHFLQAAPVKARVAPLALQLLMAYDWPGNVRELQNLLERSAVMSEAGVIEAHHLPSHLTKGFLYRDAAPPDAAAQGSTRLVSVDRQLEEIERGIILEALRRTGGIQVRAAELLGIKERSLWHRIKKYEIDIQDLRGHTN